MKQWSSTQTHNKMAAIMRSPILDGAIPFQTDGSSFCRFFIKGLRRGMRWNRSGQVRSMGVSDDSVCPNPDDPDSWPEVKNEHYDTWSRGHFEIATFRYRRRAGERIQYPAEVIWWLQTAFLRNFRLFCIAISIDIIYFLLLFFFIYPYSIQYYSLIYQKVSIHLELNHFWWSF